MNKKQTKILCTYHNKSRLFKSDVVEPCLGGACFLSPTMRDFHWLDENLLHDNSGENISYLNKTLNEMTIWYWAWKNYDKIGNPDYVGLNHYRRLFKFSKGKFSRFNILGSLGLKDSKLIDEIFENYDIIATKLDFRTVNSTVETIEGFVNVVNLKENHSGMYESFLRFKESQFYYSNNCAIFKREDFFKYCETVFGLILPACKKMQEENNLLFNSRYLGCACEFLTGFYIDYLEQEKGYRVKNQKLYSLMDIVKPIKIPYKKIFSVENKCSNDKKHKVFTILGLKISFRINKGENNNG